MTGKRRSWTIEVCRTCDRIATWPFCEHRPKVWTSSQEPWTELVTVTGPPRKQER